MNFYTRTRLGVERVRVNRGGEVEVREAGGTNRNSGTISSLRKDGDRSVTGDVQGSS